MAITDLYPTALGRTALAAAAAALALASVPALADVKDGVDAWSAGDYDAAVAEWVGPAQAGDADALFNLAQAYRLGRGVEADAARARELYEAAANRGHVKAADNYGLLLFQQGEHDKAMPLIRAAAQRGDPRAQYVLGLAHFNADFAEKDWVRAYALLTLANGAGLPQAGTAMSQMDAYIPLSQREQAQVVARQLEADAERRRSAELAAADLGSRQPVQTAANASSGAEAQPATAIPVTRTASRSAERRTGRRTERRGASPVAAAPAPTPATTPEPARAAVSAEGKWGVQLGAFGVTGNAERLWSRLSSNPALAGTRKALVPAGNVTRLRALGFTSRADAQDACRRLKAQGQNCMVTGA